MGPSIRSGGNESSHLLLKSTLESCCDPHDYDDQHVQGEHGEVDVNELDVRSRTQTIDEQLELPLRLTMGRVNG